MKTIHIALLAALSASMLFSNAVRAEDAPAEKTPPTAKTEVKSDSAASWAVFEELLRGNQRYMQGKGACQTDYSARRTELIDGQKPRALVLSCSDSRVPPEIIFSEGLGDLFVVRTAGEVADRASIASIEYAVEHLGVKLIVVLGHEACGAVKAALSVPEGESAGSADLDFLLKQIRPDIAATAGQQDKLLKESSRAHALAVAKRLSEQSHIVSEAVEKHQLLIVTGIYQLANGKVDFIF